MNKKTIFIPAAEAMRRYGVGDIRTLKDWARKGEILYQVVCGKYNKWLFESPESRYERTMGIV